MKLIINIPDEAYELLKNKSELDNIAESIIANGKPISTEGDLISRSKLKKAIEDSDIIHCVTNLWYKDILKEIDNAPTVEPKTDILEQIIAEINTSNRGTCDYYIVDRIEEIINEYQKGGAE